MRNPLARAAPAALILAAVAGCQPATKGDVTPKASASADGAGPADAPSPVGPKPSANAPFAAISADETIRFVGTEPFWGGTIHAGEMLYTTPENQKGDAIAVSRFAGNNGLGFSGSLKGAAVDMTVTPGACSDDMSDRTYPFTVTLRLGEEQRSGCAWTDRTPFTGAANP